MIIIYLSGLSADEAALLMLEDLGRDQPWTVPSGCSLVPMDPQTGRAMCCSSRKYYMFLSQAPVLGAILLISPSAHGQTKRENSIRLGRSFTQFCRYFGDVCR